VILKLFIIAPFSPEAKHGGGVVLRQLFGDFPSHKLVWYSIEEKSTGEWRKEVARKNAPFLVRFINKPRIRKYKNKLLKTVESKLLISSIVKSITEFQPDKLYFYTDLRYLHIYKKIFSMVGLPYHITVHDDPVIGLYFYDFSYSKDEIGSLFKYLYKNSQSRDVISEKMKDDYLLKYGKASEVITKGVRLSDIKSPVKNIKEEVNIFMGGEAWDNYENDKSANPLNYFLNYINFSEGIDNKKYNFFMKKKNDAYQYDFVTFYDNWLPSDEFDLLIRSMHIGYADDLLNETGKQFSYYSFPTKIITYVCFGLPFLYIGPKESAVSDLIKRYNVGVHVCNLDDENLSKALEYIFNNYEKMHKNCSVAAKELYDMDVINSQFHKLIKEEIVE
jgi:hypothetical protein